MRKTAQKMVHGWMQQSPITCAKCANMGRTEVGRGWCKLMDEETRFSSWCPHYVSSLPAFQCVVSPA